MQQDCVLCGKEVQKGGYSSKVGGVVLRPLCSECDQLCTKDPESVLVNHREVFERMLAEHRSLLAPQPESAPTPGPSSLVTQRSNRERLLVKRYDDAYLQANREVAIGKAIKVIGLVWAGMIILAALLVMTQVRGDAVLGAPLAGIVLAGMVGSFCYSLGSLVAAQGQILLASLDCAVHSSPFLTNELRAEIMSL